MTYGKGEKRAKGGGEKEKVCRSNADLWLKVSHVKLQSWLDGGDSSQPNLPLKTVLSVVVITNVVEEKFPK